MCLNNQGNKRRVIMKKGLVALTGVVVGAAAGAVATSKLQGLAEKETGAYVDKFKGYYNMLNQWLILKQQGKSLEKYFVDNNYKTIAIYGMGEMGNRLYDELKDTDIEIKYGIDQNAASTYSELEVVDKDAELEEVDVIIVSATFAFDDVEEELSQRVDYPIISLEDVVYEI